MATRTYQFNVLSAGKASNNSPSKHGGVGVIPGLHGFHMPGNSFFKSLKKYIYGFSTELRA